MIACLYCGTNHSTFQSNCKNCGGPLPGPEERAQIIEAINAPNDEVPEAPPAPRQVSNSYAWRMLLSDGWGVAALVFIILGGVFFPLGVALTLLIMTAFVGIPFAIVGFAFLGGGIWVGYRRYQDKMKTVEVLRHGLQTTGKIVSVDQNYHVRVNNRHPWNIEYAFSVDGQEYSGKVTTMNTPGPGLQPGRKTRVLYLKDIPSQSSLFPHP